MRPGLTRINELHRAVLREHGCLADKSKVRLCAVYEQIKKQCPDALVDAVMCPLKKGVDGGWVGRLFRTTEKVIAPLRRLLVMAAFGIDAKAFFNRPLSNGRVAWPLSLFETLPVQSTVSAQYRRSSANVRSTEQPMSPSSGLGDAWLNSG